ncbi:MAG: hypothetical protein N2557_06090 [Hydrogenophilus sp.]|nr:hypothetical protein [Hydrogenophilus sp.]
MATLAQIIDQQKTSALNKLAGQVTARELNRTQLNLDNLLLVQQTTYEPLITKLYLAYYGRPPTNAEKQQWYAPNPIGADQILSATTPAQLAALTPATAAAAGVVTPTGLYNYLGRGGDPQLMAQYLGSQPEYWSQLGSDLLATLYQRLFARQPTLQDRAYWAPHLGNPLLPYLIIQNAGDQDHYWLNQKAELARRILLELPALIGTGATLDQLLGQPQYAAAVQWAIARIGPNARTLEQAWLDFRHLIDPDALTPLEQLRLPLTDAERQNTIHTLALVYLGRPIQLADLDNNPDTPLPGTGSEYLAAYQTLARANGDPATLATALYHHPEYAMRLGLTRTPADEITLVYRTLFNRPPTSEELHYWTIQRSFTPLTPWQIAVDNPLLTPSDRSTLAEKIAFLKYEAEFLAARQLDPANPLAIAQIRDLIAQVGAGLLDLSALNALYRANTLLGAAVPGPAQITSVLLQGNTLTILFSEPMGWNLADLNNNGRLDLGLEIQLLVEAHYRPGGFQGQGGYQPGQQAPLADPVPNPLGSNPQIKSAAGNTLILQLGPDAGLTRPRTVQISDPTAPLNTSATLSRTVNNTQNLNLNNPPPGTPTVALSLTESATENLTYTNPNLIDRQDLPLVTRVIIAGLPDATGELSLLTWSAT